MNHATFETALVKYLDRQPFEPFAIMTDDGMRTEIDRANAVAFRPGTGVAVFLGPDRRPYFFESANVRAIG